VRHRGTTRGPILASKDPDYGIKGPKGPRVLVLHICLAITLPIHTHTIPYFHTYSISISPLYFQHVCSQPVILRHSNTSLRILHHLRAPAVDVFLRHGRQGSRTDHSHCQRCCTRRAVWYLHIIYNPESFTAELRGNRTNRNHLGSNHSPKTPWCLPEAKSFE
jgi:hypothetical protein